MKRVTSNDPSAPDSPGPDTAPGAARTFRAMLAAMLSAPNEDDPGKDNRTAIAEALIKKALNGDLPAFAAVRDTMGEKPTDKLEHNTKLDLAAAIQRGIERVRAADN